MQNALLVVDDYQGEVMPGSWEPRIVGLEKDLKDLTPRITKLEERSKIWALVLSSAAAVLIGALAWGARELYVLNGNVSKLQGSISELTPKTLNSLFSAPGNDKETMVRNAQLAAAVISSARKSSLPSNKRELALSGLKLSELLLRHSDVPELWHASGELASYRSELENPLSDRLPDCLDVSPKQRSNLEAFLLEQARPGPHPDYLETRITPYIYANCKQDIGDFDALIKKNLHMEVGAAILTAPYIFESSLIIYNSERPLPDTILEFKNCEFRIELKQEPPARSKKLVMALLSSDVKNVQLPKS